MVSGKGSNTRGKKSHADSSKEKKVILQPKKNNQIVAILLFAIAALLTLIILIPGENIWRFLHRFILGLFGAPALLWPSLLFYISITTAVNKTNENIKSKIWLSIGIIFSLNTFLFTFDGPTQNLSLNYFQKLITLYQNGTNNHGEGLFSGILGIPIVQAFGKVGAQIILFLILFVLIMALTGTTLPQLFKFLKMTFLKIKERFLKNNKFIEKESDDHKVKTRSHINEIENDHNENFRANLNEPSFKLAAQKVLKNKEASFKAPPEPPIVSGNYHYPSPTMLDESIDQDSTEIAKELQTNGKMLVNTLDNFSVRTKIVDISRGPAVTRYELQPAAGVKISKITNLADDIALNLAAFGVRIEAPIPGKAAVGVEIPNKIINIVKMRELVNSSEFTSSKSKLTVILGKDITGAIRVADLSKMPHLLIAGSTGSGKSVCINSFIISLLYKSTPDEVKLLLIDPKVVELGVYNGVPHLLVPVVTDPRKAAGALNWAVMEMMKRYQTFAENNVRDLPSYNNMIKEKLKNKSLTEEEKEKLKVLPQIVIIIDELADLMMVAPNEVEDAICRLAQMARAAGMHLVIATQRPSVDVITGIIKANIPSRIALAVSSQIDSRTILDSSGAEKLLGRGDMLFSPIGVQKPVRIQGCFVTDKEIENVIKFIKESNENNYDKDIMEEIEKNAVLDTKDSSSKQNFDDDDPMLKDAIQCVIEAGQASTSYLQRKLRLGFARAGRLMDQMEQRGIIGPPEGSKPRQVLVNSQKWKEMNEYEI